jgi:hypothetical protein
MQDRNLFMGNTHIDMDMQALNTQLLRQEFWQNLHTQIDLLDVKILEKLYIPDTEPQLLCMIFNRLKRLNYSKETIRRRVYYLRDIGLLKIVDQTRPLVLWPIDDLKANVKTMVTLFYARLGLKQNRDLYD